MTTPTSRMPAIFIGHGSPMNAIEDTVYSRAWQSWGTTLPRPKAILCISAHWMTPGVGVTAMSQPQTIHDFGGFPPELHAVQYPAPGSPALAERVQKLLAPLPVMLDQSWGLDHGAWSVLMHLYPHADVPIVQISLDLYQPASFHYQLGQALRPLRDEGIMLVASGNVVHNLRLLQWENTKPAPAWAGRVENTVIDCLLQHEHAALIDYPALDEQAQLAIPTPEHYLPLLYIAGAQLPGEKIQFPVKGIEMGSLSMLSVQVG